MTRDGAPGPRGIVGCVQGVEMLDWLNTRALGSEFPESLFSSPDSETDTDQVWISSPIPSPILNRAIETDSESDFESRVERLGISSLRLHFPL